MKYSSIAFLRMYSKSWPNFKLDWLNPRRIKQTGQKRNNLFGSWWYFTQWDPNKTWLHKYF